MVFCDSRHYRNINDSVQPEGYLKDLRRRDEELAKGWGQIATPLKVSTEGGIQTMNCASVEGIFRLIQSIPSPKAESFHSLRSLTPSYNTQKTP